MSKKQARPDENARLDWRKSSFSSVDQDCVEVAPTPGGGVAIRDSKVPHGPIMKFTKREWTAFLNGAREGEFDGMA